MKKPFLIIVSFIIITNSYSQMKILSDGTALLAKTTWGNWTSAYLDWSMSGGYPVLYGDNNNFFIGKGTNYVNHIFVNQIDCYSLANHSDKREKANIRLLGNTLNKLKKVNGVKYKYKSEYKPKTAISDTTDEFGFIAQDIKEIFPELVKKDSVTGMYSIYYLKMIPIIVEAIKEQQLMIEDLQNKLEKKSSTVKSATEANIQTTSIVDANQPDKIVAVLYQNNPNPFNESTKISFYLPNETNNALLYIYDMQGLQIKSIPINNRGYSSVTINGWELKAGMYYYTLIADGQAVDTKKMILTK